MPPAVPPCTSLIASMKLKLVILFIPLTILLGIFTIFPVHDPDIWLHFKLGEYILTHYTIPNTDIFTYTCYGERWIPHEWLVSVIFYTVHCTGGMLGIVLLKFLIILASFLIIYTLAKHLSSPPWASVLLLTLAVFPFTPGFTPRAQLFTFLFLSILLLLIHLYRKQDINFRLLLVGTIVIFLLWGNMHMGVIFGLVVVFLFATFTAKQHPQRSLTLLLSALIATLVNPNTYHVLLYPITTPFTQEAELKHFIIEYLPMFAPEHKDLTILLHYKIFTLSVIISWVINIIWRREYFYTALSILFFPLPLLFYRFLPLFVLISLPSLLTGLGYIARKIPLKERYLNAMAMAIIVTINAHIILFGYNEGQGIRRYIEWTQSGIAQRVFPEGAVEFLRKNNINGKMYNSYAFGEYLIWKGFSVFIDGRSDVCGIDLVRQASAIESGDKPTIEKTISQYNITIFLLEFGTRPARTHKTEDIHHYLHSSQDWKLVYWDDCCLLYLKHIPKYAQIIKQYAFNYLNPITLDLESAPLTALIEEARWQIQRVPQCITAYSILAHLYIALGDYGSALQCYKTIIHIAPKDPAIPTILMRIGDTYLIMNDGEKALYYYNLALRYKQKLPGIRDKIKIAQLIMGGK